MIILTIQENSEKMIIVKTTLLKGGDNIGRSSFGKRSLEVKNLKAGHET